MDVFDAVDSRISCRWFLDKPVDQTIVRELIAKAARAASGGNLQPRRAHALTGARSAEHTSELQSLTNLVLRLLHAKNNNELAQAESPVLELADTPHGGRV